MEDRTQLYKQEIATWLNQEEKDFTAGLELYIRFGHNKALALQMVRKNLLSKLVYELRKIAERPVIRETRTGKERLQKAVEKTKKAIEAKKLRKTRKPAKPKTTDVIKAKKQELEAEIDRMVEAAKEEIEEIVPAKVKISSTGKEISLNDLPPRLQAKWEENREKYKLMRAWHEKMKLAKTDKERAKYRAELVALDDKIAANWKEIDNFAATGETETEAEHEILLTPAEQAKELNACRSFISRNITKVAVLDGTKREELLKKLAERVATLWKYNAEIKEDTRAELAKLGLMTDENKRS